MRLVLLVAFVHAAVPTAFAAGVRFPSEGAQQRAVNALLARATIVSCAGPHGNAVALTFDDGPGPHTAKLVDVLRRAHGYAPFFIVANSLEYWPRLASA